MILYFDASRQLVLVPIVLIHSTTKVGRVFILDTGATTTCLSPGVAITLGLKSLETQKAVRLQTAFGGLQVPMVSVPQILIGGVRLHDREMILHSVPIETGAHGILGLDILRYFDLRINFKKGEIDLRRA